QAAEIVGMPFAGVTVQERVRTQENGAILIVEGSWDNAIVQGRWINVNKEAAHKAEQRSHGQAEAVENRQAIKNSIGIGDIRYRKHLPNVGENVEVGKRDP